MNFIQRALELESYDLVTEIHVSDLLHTYYYELVLL